MKRFLLVWTILVISSGAARAKEIGYIEQFALAKDRAQALAQLIPGTEDYYYYHCLHYQHLEQFDKVEELLKTWIKRYNYTARVNEIRNRQALLTYERDPAASLEFIRAQLNLQFNHQRETLGAKPNLPTALDQRLISRETLTARAKARYKNLQGFEDAALDWLVASELNADRRRHLLERLQRPDHASLPSLVVADLNYRSSRGFGGTAIHRQLLLSQLDECLLLKKDLLNQGNFVNTYLIRLWPDNDVDWRNNAEQQAAYLDRLAKFTARLAPVHNSLKAHVIYHRLLLDRFQGVYDRDLFMTYIKLPRNVRYINRDFMKLETSRRYPVNLGQNFSSLTMLPPIGDDEPLVRTYLQHFFKDEVTHKAFASYIDDTYLKHTFAETKIVNGLGEAEQWYSMLPPDKYQQLKERIDLDFAHTNKQVFAANEPVSLDLLVKNAKTLLVKVYEINTENFYRENLRPVNTDINLDGLVANSEETHEFVEPPLRRVARHFEFPQLRKPGVYVVDFIGNGKSSRVVVRKGSLRHNVRDTTGGHVFTVLDDENNVVKDATLWMAGHEYKPDDEGRIQTPFSSQPGRQPIILARGDFSSLAHFEHRAENYELRAGIFVDRESLLKQKQAKVLVRPGLFLNGTPVTLSVLEKTQLVITSVDQDGVATSKEVKDFLLREDRESSYEFRVPERLAQISFQLQAKVKSLSLNKTLDLATAQTFTLNAIDKTVKVEDLHLAQYDGRYFVETLGKTGEPKKDRPVQLALKHRDFRNTVNVTLKTDAKGRIALGSLLEIVNIKATGPEGTSQSWNLLNDRHTMPVSLHGAAGEPLELAYMGGGDEPPRDELSLIELRGDTFQADRFDAISLNDGLIVIDDLPPGDYDLLLKRSGQRMRLRLTKGPQRLGYVMGEARRLEVRGDGPLQIASVGTEKDAIEIKLRNASKFARVHVFATRYQPAFSAYDHLSRVRDIEPYRISNPKLLSLYAQGRNIGDEYRYILERRFAAKFPGNMLERPSLLLSPWAIRKTETGQQLAAPGGKFAPKAPGADAKSDRGGGGGARKQPQGAFSNLDFVSDATTVAVNLTPDKKGVVSLPLADLNGKQHLHVVAVDPRNTAYRRLSLPESEPEVRDLRLLAGLDPEKHFTRQKQVSVVPAKQQFRLQDITTSKFESYDTLTRAYTLYLTLSGDSTLAEFGFILNWPKMKPEEKREKYSKYACHELNLFLYKKDPEFFERVVQPFLKNKKDKTFVDLWLVNEDLANNLQSWNYDQLNAVERILLSERIRGEQKITARHIRDLFDLIPPDTDRTDYLFNTAVKRSALDTSDALGMDEAVKGVLDSRALKRRTALAGRPSAATPPPGEPSDRPGAEAEPAAALSSGKKAAEKSTAKLKRGQRGRGMDRELGEGTDKDADGFFYERANNRSESRRLYQKLDKTQEWVENNYYHLPIEQQNASLITPNAFWTDFAERDPETPFYSANLAEASRNFSEIMLALAMLDLPFEAKEHETKFEEAQMTLRAASPMVVFHEEIRPAKAIAEQTPILVSQNFFRQSDRYRHVQNQRYDKYVTEEFLVGAVYGCQIVVTNPTSSPQKLDLLLQVPTGSLPVLNGQFTKSMNINLQPFNTQTVEYYFYFPAVGQFEHYPVHVSTNEQLVASAKPFRFKVVEKLSKIDTTSWAYISQFGSSRDVLDYLNANNLHRTKLDKIAFRMQDKAFFKQVTDLLAKRHAYDHTLWSYSIKHADVSTTRQYLQHANSFVAKCGAAIDSPLLTIDPVLRKTFQHRDYKPLVNARAHQLGKRRQILNNRLHEQYHQTLKVLSYRRQLSDGELMAVTYYLLLQDRIAEALEFFVRVDPDKLETRLQHDYFKSYLSFYSDDQRPARELADKYEDFPVDHWRNAFAAIDKQLDELGGQDFRVVDDKNRTQQQTQLAATEPSFDFKVEAKKVKIDYQHLPSVKVNYYLMDIELMFSTTPFVQQYGGQFAYIRPNGVESVKLPKGKNVFEFELPEDLHNRNVLVEVSGAGVTKTQAYYSNSMSLQVIENYGHLRVSDQRTRKPLPKVYVKVYAKMKDGTVRFYKDGYTDLRGRFDYTSLNTNELDFVSKLSILILSDEQGAVVREANPPKR